MPISFYRSMALVLTLLAATVLPACGGQNLSVSLVKPKVGYLRVNEPLVLDFNQKIDAKSFKASLDPVTDFSVEIKSKKVMLTAITGWKAGQSYLLKLTNVQSSDHSSQLSSWKAKFLTQPRVGIAGYLVDGKAVPTTDPTMRPTSVVTITFTAAMNSASAPPTRNGQTLPDFQFAWAADAASVAINGSYLPFQTNTFGVGGKPLTAKGDVATDLSELSIKTLGIEPSNSTSSIPADFVPPTPLLVVIDNAGDARPQSGLQSADMAFEYLSEYGISRFTLTYFNQPADLVGPVRSCRMINAFLLEAFHGIQLCSGGSVGTLHYLYGDPLLATNINDFDRGGHFYRVNFKAAPHNLFTDAGRATRLRSEMNIGGAPYTIDPPHPDNSAGAPADAPSIGLHGVSYSYDGGAQVYRAFDHGSPRVDAGKGGAQLGVKNVVLMHVAFRDAGWVEDENGGAHSIWYEMNGSGPAEVWSNGRLVHATWHEGTDGQTYFQNTTQPVYFTDEGGNLLRLNTGLTWVHVVGNGQ